MNAPINRAACEAFEHDLADLVDGLLDETNARRVQAHLASCANCRDWQAGYASLHARLQAALPRPEISADFDATLAARVRALQTRGRDLQRAAADAEHDALLASLRRYSRRRMVLGALGGAVTAGSLLVLAQQWLLRDATLHAALHGGDKPFLFTAAGALIALGVIAWSLSRSAIVTPRFARW
jgi:anti-sigma factor RsiW